MQPCLRVAAQAPRPPSWRSSLQRLFTSALEKPAAGSHTSSRISISPLARTPHPTALPRYGASRSSHSSSSSNRGGLLARRFAHQGSQRRGFRFSSWRRSGSNSGGDSAKKAAESLSLSARLKKLSKEYGWAAVGVYLGLSVLDFPFCFLLVRVVGTERIGQLEHYIVSAVRGVVPESLRTVLGDLWHRLKGVRGGEQQPLGDAHGQAEDGQVGWGVERARERNQEEASLATQLALAYAIHKSFIFLRVPLTAAVTPKVVKILRSWGWNIGRKTPPPPPPRR